MAHHAQIELTPLEGLHAYKARPCGHQGAGLNLTASASCHGPLHKRQAETTALR